MRTSALALAFVVLASCRVTPRGSSSTGGGAGGGPSGAGGWLTVHCSGGMDDCFTRAAAVCPAGYDVGGSGSAYAPKGTSYEPHGTTKGTMLIKCAAYDTTPWRKVHAEGCSFSVPVTFGEETIDGSVVHHPHDSYVTQVTITSGPRVGSLEAYAAKEYPGKKVDSTSVDGRSVLAVTQQDELQDVRITTMLVPTGKRVCELTCTGAPAGALSPLCRRILFSVRADEDS